MSLAARVRWTLEHRTLCHRDGSLIVLSGSLDVVAIKLYYALALMMAKARVDLTPGQVAELMRRWLAGEVRAWGEPAHDPATGWVLFQLWLRTDSGQPVQVTGRITPPDFYIVDVRPLTATENAEFTQWEAHDD